MKLHFLTHPSQTTWSALVKQALDSSSLTLMVFVAGDALALLALKQMGTLETAVFWLVEDDSVTLLFKLSLMFVTLTRGRIFSCERPFYERAVSDLDP